MEEEVESILLLIDELKSEDHNIRLHSINSLEQIAEAIGEERTREELIPYINELLEDDNEEVLLALAAKLGELSNYLGGPHHMNALLTPLNTLASNEEQVVRDKAVESINSIAAKVPLEVMQEELLGVVKALATSDWYSARIAGCALVRVPFERIGDKELLRLFKELVKDDTPMVRRAAAAQMGAMIQISGSKELKSLIEGLSSDEHDSVRQMTLESALSVYKTEEELLWLAKKYSVDKSWRVRYTFLEHFREVLGPVENAQELVSYVVNLLSDSEPEVRSIMLDKLEVLASKVSNQVIVTQILPALEKLAKDPSHYVKLSLMTALCQISYTFGSDMAIVRALPMINQLIRDESFEVRMSFAENMRVFNEAIGPEKVITFSVPLITQMMNDSQWRVRLKVVEYLPQLAELLGSDKFTEHLGTSVMKWIEDPVFAIRESVLDSLKQVSGLFGENWLKQRLLPQIQILVTNPVFSKRMTALRALFKLGEILPREEVVSALQTLSQDSVPNIRFNVAKCVKHLKELLYNDKRVIESLQSIKEDPDSDVRFFVQETLNTLGK